MWRRERRAPPGTRSQHMQWSRLECTSLPREPGTASPRGSDRFLLGAIDRHPCVATGTTRRRRTSPLRFHEDRARPSTPRATGSVPLSSAGATVGPGVTSTSKVPAAVAVTVAPARSPPTVASRAPPGRTQQTVPFDLRRHLRSSSISHCRRSVESAPALSSVRSSFDSKRSG